jgi:hypothetical protein
MNAPYHNWHNLRHYGLRGHAEHAREMRQRRFMVRAGWLLMIALALASASRCAHAYEPGNAPDVRGHFVLVVGGTSILDGYAQGSPVQRHWLQPFIIPGFTSFKLCVGAGKELQARLNSDGYTLDFSCIATGK